MSKYRTLNPDEIVRDGDEVESQYCEWVDDFTILHNYYGKKVSDCKGYVTNTQRIFRRKEVVPMPTVNQLKAEKTRRLAKIEKIKAEIASEKLLLIVTNEELFLPQ